MKDLKNFSLVIAGMLVAFLASGMATMVSAHGGDTTRIHACLNPGSGTIFIVDAGQACGQNQVALDWNIQGPAGLQGPQGLQGPPGPAGIGGFVSNDLTGAYLQGADLPYRNLQNTILSNATLAIANLAGADLSGVNLSRANLIGADLRNARLNNANLTFADLRDVTLANANLTGADLSHARLNRANLTNAIVNDVIYDDTSCPDDTNSDNNGDTCSGHGAP